MARISMLMMSIIILAWVTNLVPLVVSGKPKPDKYAYVRDACSVTRYRDLCVSSLASFSSAAKKSPSKWARAGVSVTITEAKSEAQYLRHLKKHPRIKGKRNQAAVSDCVELFEDAIDELHRSLGTLRKLNRQEFGTQMGDVNTWVSAALTNEDTCLDGFEGNDQQVKILRNRVLRATYITSNALALVNKLATAGIPSAEFGEN